MPFERSRQVAIKLNCITDVHLRKNSLFEADAATTAKIIESLSYPVLIRFDDVLSCISQLLMTTKIIANLPDACKMKIMPSSHRQRVFFGISYTTHPRCNAVDYM